MTQDTIRTTLQAATLAIVALGALAGLGAWAITAIVAEEVRPLQERVATLEEQGAAILKLQEDVAMLQQGVAALRTDSEWIKATLAKIEAKISPPPQ